MRLGGTHRISIEHLIAENTACPSIHRLSVTVGLNDFGCEVLGCPAQRPCVVVDNLGEPKVGNFEVATRVRQEVLRFKITIDNVERAKVAECEDDDGKVEPGYVCGETLEGGRTARHLGHKIGACR